MELETVEIKVPKGFVRDGFRLVIDQVYEGETPVKFIENTMYGETLYLILRPIAKEKHGKQSKPDWTPPKLKKGWVTWDEACGWYWWENHPEYHAVDFWTYPKNGCVFENEEIGSVMAEILGCPCCDGFDERNCIWEVGQ